MLALALIILGSTASLVAFEYGEHWPYHLGPIVGWLGFALTIVSAVMQYVSSKPYLYEFEAGDWIQGVDGYRLIIPQRKHGKHVGSVDGVFRRTDTGYEQVECDVGTEDDNTIVAATEPFVGRVVIK
jgi:hypothetical protein